MAEVFHIGDKHVLVTNIPASVCNRCGDATFSADTVEQVRALAHSETEPAVSIRLNVFKFQQQSEAAATPGH